MTTSTDVELFLSAAEVAKLTGYSKNSIYRFVMDGTIPHRKLSRRKTLFLKTEILQWVDERSAQLAATP